MVHPTKRESNVGRKDGTGQTSPVAPAQERAGRTGMLVLCVEIFIRRDMVVSIGRVASGKIEGTTLSLPPLQQHLERLPDFSFRHGVFTLAVSMQKLALRFEACGFHFEVFAPCYEIVEIHIDG